MSLLFALVLLGASGVRGQEEKTLLIWLNPCSEGDETFSCTTITYNAAFLEEYETQLRHENIVPIFVTSDDDTNYANLWSHPAISISAISTDNYQEIHIIPLNSVHIVSSSILEAQWAYSSGTQVIPNDPNSLHNTVNFAIGMSLYSLGQCDEAIPYLQSSYEDRSSIPADPYFPIASTFYLANCMIEQQDLETAATLLERIRSCCYEYLHYFVPIHTNLGWVYLQLGRESDAFHVFDIFFDAHADDPNNLDNFTLAEILTRRSQLYALAFRFDEAVADMDAAIELTPDNPYLYVERGQRLLLLYEWDRALADYNHALELDPNYADAYYYRGILYASTPEGIDARAEAIADFQHYLELAPNGAHAEDAQHYLTQIESQLDSLEATPSTREN